MGEGVLEVTRVRNYTGSSIVRSWTDSLRLLKEASGLLERHLGVSLPVSLDADPSDVKAAVRSGKEFSTALLEGRPHPWQSPLRLLPSRTRMTVEGSLFLWRKTLPVVEPPTASAHRARVTAPEIVLPPGYLAYLEALAMREFPTGWDHDYHGFVERDVPTIKSVTDRKRKDGGWRATAPSRMDHGLVTMGYSEAVSECVVKFMVAPCDGKDRAVTVMSASDQVLKPLHKALYSQISKRPWLLRGEATPSVFRKAGMFRRRGEEFISGDYESATDHLPVSAAEALLRGARKNSRFIPDTIWDLAFKFLRVRIQYPDLPEPVQATRQLMGSLLCFPLLCLQNYAAFRWIFGPEVPVKINGDDIVFRSTIAKYEEWADFVGSVGLVLSKGKTMTHPRFFSLNSHYFEGNNSRVSLIPVIRFTTISQQKCTYPNGLAGAFNGFLKRFQGELRESLGAWWLREKKNLIRKSGRSVVRGLKIPATESMLKAANLWYREIWYLNSVPVDKNGQEAKLPSPPTKLEGQVEIPAGWRRVPLRKGKERTAQVSQEEEFFEILTDAAWGQVSKDSVTLEREYFKELAMSGFETAWAKWSSRRPFRGIRVGMVKSRLKCKPFYLLSIPRRQKTVWCHFEAPDEREAKMNLVYTSSFDTDGELVLLPPVEKLRPVRFKYGGLVSEQELNSEICNYRWTDSVPSPWLIKFQKKRLSPAEFQWRGVMSLEDDEANWEERRDQYLDSENQPFKLYEFVPPPACLGGESGLLSVPSSAEPSCGSVFSDPTGFSHLSPVSSLATDNSLL